MKIAAFNVENLFDRAKAFNEDSAEATRIVEAEARLNVLFEKPDYSDADKAEMIALLAELGLTRSDNARYARIRKIRGKLVKRPRDKPIEIVASGRDDWVGWAELKSEPVDETAVLNTSRVIRDVNADILAVVEAEDRVALKQFSDIMLEKVDGRPYDQIMLIDGNDDRGIDVGVMTKLGYDIGLMRSHVHDLNAIGLPVFSRDCPEFAITTPTGELIWVLPNHFKSKYGGNDPESQDRRLGQATRAAEIYRLLRDEGHDKIVVLGDFNDTPDSEPLAPLLQQTDLKDVSEHPSFTTGEFTGRPGSGERGYGTHGLGNDDDKIDYLLLSPALFGRVTEAGLFRMGAWPGSRPPRWSVYPELEKPLHAASDHHVIWAEIGPA